MSKRTSPRRIGIVAFPNCQIIDATGPAGVFGAANVLAQTSGHKSPPYEVMLIAPNKGAVRTSSGVSLHADHAAKDLAALKLDTLICAGGKGARPHAANTKFIGHIAAAAPACRRVVSVCSGAFLLAATGLLSGRRAATHWAHCRELQSLYPDISVDEKPIFIRDGNVYTSAGVTAGLDLSLALVQADLGPDIVAAVARDMVMFVRRPGNQAQYSRHLWIEDAADGRLKDTIQWAVDNIDADITVEALADRAAMSVRSFHRHFKEQLGLPPARLLTELRLESAKRYLEQSTLALTEVAVRSGFGAEDKMRRAFVTAYGVAPSAYRQQFTDMDTERMPS